MAEVESEFKHIVLDEAGRAWIDGTCLKVLELVEACQAYGWSPEEYHLQHPGIAMVQICAALAYYYEHQIEMDRQIMDGAAWAASEHQRNRQETAALRDRLRRMRQKSA